VLVLSLVTPPHRARLNRYGHFNEELAIPAVERGVS